MISGSIENASTVLAVALKACAILMLSTRMASAADAMDPEQIMLGRELFFDKNLSADRSIACSSCHMESRAFSDGKRVSPGASGHSGTRNAPSLRGVGAYRQLFWDGRADTLEGQAVFPLYSPIEMGLSGEAELLSRVRENRGYVREFQRLAGTESATPTAAFVVQALAAYERSLVPRTTPLDDYLAGNEVALSPEAKSGLALFRGRAGCSTCHRLDDGDASLTDNQFHESSVGVRAAGKRFPALALQLTRMSLKQRLDLIPRDSRVAALGRFVVTLEPKDMAFFRTPSLREAKLTAPYMHDGSIRSLQEAVDVELYYRGLQQGYPVNFSLAERRDIRLFIESATPAVSSNERLTSQRSATFIVSTRHE